MIVYNTISQLCVECLEKACLIHVLTVEVNGLMYKHVCICNRIQARCVYVCCVISVLTFQG